MSEIIYLDGYTNQRNWSEAFLDEYSIFTADTKGNQLGFSTEDKFIEWVREARVYRRYSQINYHRLLNRVI